MAGALTGKGLAMTTPCRLRAGAAAALHCCALLLLLSFASGLLAQVPAAAPQRPPSKPAKIYSQEACESKFWSHSRTHSACLVTRDLPADLSRDDRRLIVDLHNKYRASVEQLPGQPPAADMQAMVWDDELAKVAAKWASLCLFEHDRGADRSIPDSYEVGQNLAIGQASWSLVVTRWWQEGAEFTYGSASAEGSNKQSTGHYVQVVWATSSRVGCAASLCGAAGTLFACNYAHAVGIGSHRWLPYQQGPPGSACPSVYDAATGLCDCKGKICKNDGVLDLKTCQCRCSGRAPWLKSTDCSVNCSAAEDRKVCATKGGAWDASYCRSYGNVKHEFCPIMCGMCPASQPLPLGSSANSSLSTGAVLATEGPDTEDDVGDEETEGENDDRGFGNEVEEEEDDDDAGDGESKADDSEDNGKEPNEDGGDDDGGGEDESSEDDEQDELPRCTTVDDAICIQVTMQLPAGGAEQGATATLAAADGSSALDQCRKPYHHCPAMCGQCLATMCKDATGRPKFIGDTWLTASGLHGCSEQGVSVSRGCVTANRVDVIPIGQQRNDTWNDIVYSCMCNVVKSVLKLSCKPFDRAVATRDQLVPAPAVYPDDVTARSVIAHDSTDSENADAESSTPDAPPPTAVSSDRSVSASPLLPPTPRCLHQDPPFCGSAVFARMAVHMRCARGTRCPAACGHCVSSDTHPSYSAFLNELPASTTAAGTSAASPSTLAAGRGRSLRTKQPHAARSATSAPLPPSTVGSDEEPDEADVADCTAAEPARCGQPSARGFFLPSQCRHVAVQQSCPAMCKLCKASACLDYTGRRYSVGDTWVSDFAQLLCTPTGVTAEKGCYFTQLRQFVPAGASRNYTDGMLHYSCTCRIDDDETTLDCTRTILIKGSAVQLPAPTTSQPSSPAALRPPHGTGQRSATIAGQRALQPSAGMQQQQPPRGQAAAAWQTSTSLPSSASTALWHAHSTAATAPPPSSALAAPTRPPASAAVSHAAASTDSSGRLSTIAAAASERAVSDGASTAAATSAASATTRSAVGGLSPALPACSQPEEAKCGQPSSSGYYTAGQCRHPTVLRLCPAMCGKCLAIACKDYSGRTYGPEQSWISPGFGRMSCTEKGIAVEDGCYFKSRDVFVPTNRSYEYAEFSMVLSCLCERVSSTQLRMSCKTKT